LSPDYKDRLLTLTDENVEQVSSGRVDIWEHGMKMVLDHPFGVGPAGFLELSPQYIPQKFLEKSEGKRAAHNTYLLVLAEQGWLGLLLYLVLIATVYRQFHRCWLKLKKDECLFAEREIIFQVKVEYVYLAFLASFTVFVSSVFFASRLYFEFFYILLSLLVVFFHLVDENRAGLQQGAL
jgi:O-antigen ligase